MEEERIDNMQEFYDANLCKKCHNHMIDRSENDKSCLCRECREEYIKLKIPKWIYAVMAAIVICMIVAFTNFPTMIKDYAKYANANRKAENGYVITALNDLVEVVEKYPGSKKMAMRLTDIGMRYQYYDYAAYAIDNNLAGREVSDAEYDRLDGYIRLLDKYYATYDLADALGADFETATTEDEYYAVMDEYYNGLEAELDNNTYDRALIYYYMSYATDDLEKREECLKNCLEESEFYFDAAAQLATHYRRMGDFEQAEEILEREYSINKEDWSLLRSYATLKMAQNQPEKGLEFAKEAYNQYPEGDYVIDTYIIALAANGQMEEAQEIKTTWEEQGYVFEDDLEQFLAGKMTLQEYYVGY